MSKRSLLFAVGAAMAAATAAGAVQAASPEFCRDYAIAAVRQSHIAREHWGWCRRFVWNNPARWQTDFRGHFDWCRSVRRWDAQRERDARTAIINDCARR